MRIFIRTIYGKSYEIDIQGETTILKAKHLLLEKFTDDDGIDTVGRIRFIFAGKDLDNEKTCSELNILYDSTIHMYLRLDKVIESDEINEQQTEQTEQTLETEIKEIKSEEILEKTEKKDEKNTENINK